ncbi:MAG: hypothetical protein J1F33_08020 [Clostridiales bacterium]|nr:hypothetical protein [Clostridiales bacterium]
MKKIKSVLMAAMAVVCLPLAACSTDNPESNKGKVDQGDKNIYPISSHAGGSTLYMGDVMPFYDDGVMNIYQLQDRVGSQYMFYHPFARLTTTDYVTYKDEGVAINFEEDLKSMDAALGTGSFIKSADGKYHCFYTGHNSDRDATGKPHTEAIRHAVSTDGQKTWTKVEDFHLFGNSDDFRDPYVYFDSVDECYYMLVTTNDNGKGVIKQYQASSLDANADEWTDNGVFFENDAGSYNMECPSYIEYNGYWYLAYSEQGSDRVTHYRYKTERDGEWKKFDLDKIDSTGFYAGRLEKAGDKLYAFAWCAKLTGGDVGEFDWGGNLVVHEIKQSEDGELRAVLIDGVKNAFKTSVDYYTVKGEKASSFTFKGDKFTAYGLDELSNNITRMHFTLKLDELNGECGVTFGIDGGAYDNRLGTKVLSFKATENRIVCYNDVANILRYGKELTSVNYKFEAGKEYDVDIMIDGEIAVLYFNSEVALSTRLVGIQQKGLAFYSNGAKASVKGIAFYE